MRYCVAEGQNFLMLTCFQLFPFEVQALSPMIVILKPNFKVFIKPGAHGRTRLVS